MLHEFNTINQNISNVKAIFSIKGPITQGIIGEMGNILRKKLEQEDIDKKTILNIFAIVIEQAQNIVRYSAEKIILKDRSDQRNLGAGIIIVGYENSHYYVFCGNQIKNDAIDTLSAYLNKLKGMDLEALKELYRNQRKKRTETRSSSAGLGFIEIAKRVKQPIQFQIEEIDDDTSFFSMKAVI